MELWGKEGGMREGGVEGGFKHARFPYRCCRRRRRWRWRSRRQGHYEDVSQVEVAVDDVRGVDCGQAFH